MPSGVWSPTWTAPTGPAAGLELVGRVVALRAAGAAERTSGSALDSTELGVDLAGLAEPFELAEHHGLCGGRATPARRSGRVPRNRDRPDVLGLERMITALRWWTTGARATHATDRSRDRVPERRHGHRQSIPDLASIPSGDARPACSRPSTPMTGHDRSRPRQEYRDVAGAQGSTSMSRGDDLGGSGSSRRRRSPRHAQGVCPGVGEVQPRATIIQPNQG